MKVTADPTKIPYRGLNLDSQVDPNMTMYKTAHRVCVKLQELLKNTYHQVTVNKREQNMIM